MAFPFERCCFAAPDPGGGPAPLERHVREHLGELAEVRPILR